MAHMIVCPKLSVPVTRDAGSTLETPGASPGTDGRPATQAFLVIAALGLIASVSIWVRNQLAQLGALAAFAVLAPNQPSIMSISWLNLELQHRTSPAS